MTSEEERVDIVNNAWGAFNEDAAIGMIEQALSALCEEGQEQTATALAAISIADSLRKIAHDLNEFVFPRGFPRAQ